MDEFLEEYKNSLHLISTFFIVTLFVWFWYIYAAFEFKKKLCQRIVELYFKIAAFLIKLVRILSWFRKFDIFKIWYAVGVSIC